MFTLANVTIMYILIMGAVIIMAALAAAFVIVFIVKGVSFASRKASENTAKKQELDAFVQKTGHSREEVIRTRKWFSDSLNNRKYEYHETFVPQPNQPRYTSP